MTDRRENLKSTGGTKVKLCGLRRIEDAAAANAAGPEFAGFILSPGFRRSIPLEQAEALRQILSPGIRTVGVFVDAPREEILRAAQSGCIDMIQLHGSEDDRCIREIALASGLPVIRAFRISGRQDLEAAAASAAQWVLLDSGAGTGQAFDWDLLERFLQDSRKDIPIAFHASPADPFAPGTRLFPGGHPWILAGGLSAENAAEAVRRFHPTAVDVSSRVETDGWKDPRKMREFTRTVHAV